MASSTQAKISIFCAMIVITLILSSAYIFSVGRFSIPQIFSNSIYSLVGELEVGDRLAEANLTIYTNFPAFPERDYVYFTSAYPVDKQPLATWSKLDNSKRVCDDNLIIYGEHFATAHDIVFDPRGMYRPEATGGIPLKDLIPILNQIKPDFGKYEPGKGLWKINCNSQPGGWNPVHVPFYGLTSFISKEEWSKLLLSGPNGQNITVFSNFTIAFRRGDYANMHQYTMNTFNIFLLMVALRKQPREITLLIVDDAPQTFAFDQAWERAYGPTIHAGHLKSPVLFKNVAWNIPEPFSPIAQYKESEVYYLEDFRSFFIQQHGLNPNYPLNCTRPHITVIYRRNKVYHLGNIEGNVGRKILNEAEIVSAIKSVIPNVYIRAPLLEVYPMGEQLSIISSTDILVGMHGAGMSHTMYLPRHAGVLEMFPKDFKVGRPWYCVYEAICRWRKLHYISWENRNSTIELPFDQIAIPLDMVVSNVKSLYEKICHVHLN
ncbi:hypothetical protein CHS0354_032703 [Potamilus streckersoni]|uniref:Glycosyltransferase 61 catalytic domain-containing protein n=1 Tax=Potamilus streckersoni TaxID=2493646 RepID=A0AAE0VI93_9BIVA|nr:hypothetical protein CHS0354_032703 [Potamilus streckersoni]